MSKGRMQILPCLALIAILTAPAVILLPEAGAAPQLYSIKMDPADPTIADEFNVSIILSESPISARIQYCGPGLNGLCYPPEDMRLGGNETTYFIQYAKGNFFEGEYHFLMDVEFAGSVFIHREFNISFRPIPTSIMIEALDPPAEQSVGLFPDQSITVTGHVRNNLSEPVTGAWVNLSIVGSGPFENTTTDDSGNFHAILSFDQSGSFVMCLLIVDPIWDLVTSASWPVIVSEWPLPALVLHTSLGYDPSSSPPGSEGVTLYMGSDLILNYSFENVGTGKALNFTRLLNISGTTNIMGPTDLTEGGYINGTVVLPTDVAGDYFVSLNCTYEQTAPLDLKGEEPTYFFTYSIVDRPTWEPHRVLVEMFTQGTCVPCVNVEEAIEIFREDDTDLFEFIMYALDDDASSAVAAERGVTGTPHVFIDGNFDQIIGGGDVEDVIGILNATIWNASGRITPPLGIGLDRNESNYWATVTLSNDYDGEVSGRLVVYSIESYSNLRNNQGIPIRNRYSDERARSDPLLIRPGDSKVLENISLPGPGLDLLAVFYDENGSVLQVRRTDAALDPIVYLKRETPIVRIKGMGNATFNLAIESFYRDTPIVADPSFNVSIRLSIGDLEVRDEMGDVLSTEGTDFTFQPTGTEVLGAGRTRAFQNIALEVISLNNTARTTSFQVILATGANTYTNSVAVIQTRTDPKVTPKIVHYSLVGEGDSIYFTARVISLPAGASLIGTVVPTSGSGSSGARGSPVTVTLSALNDTDYKAPVTGIDLGSYDHLSYSLRIEKDGSVINQTSEKMIPISDLIGARKPSDGNDDDPTIILILIACALLVAIIAGAVIFFVLRMNRSEVAEPDSIEGPEPVGPEEVVVEAQDTPPGEQAPVITTTVDPSVREPNPPVEQTTPGPEQVGIPNDGLTDQRSSI